MKSLTKFLLKVDSIAPDPWYVDGVEQTRPIVQLGMIIGVIIGFIIGYFIF